MKITRILLHQPAGLLRLLTDTGLEGHCTGVAASASNVDRVASILLDTNPVDRERTWWAMKDPGEGLPSSLRAGTDIALWDLSAKIAGRPLFRHLGGFRDRIPVCWTGAAAGTDRTGAAAGTDQTERAPSEIIREAQEAQQAGFGAYRFGLRSDATTLIQLVREVRAAVGPEFPLIFDGQARCVIEEAIRIGRALDETDYFYFDRPRPPGDHSGGKQVAGEIDTPTSTEVSSPMEASQVMSAGSADHIRTDVQSCGGLTDVLKSARCAEAFGAYCHLGGIGICDGFAHLHLAGALRNTPFIEMTGHETGSPVLRNVLQAVNGLVQVPDLPGLGMEVDLDAVMVGTTELIEV